MASLLAVVLTGCSKKQATLAKLPEPIKTESNKPEKTNEPIIENIQTPQEDAPRLPAVIKAENKSSIGFQTSGVISKIYVQPGDVVKSNAVLAALDSTTPQFDLENAKLELETKKIVYEQAKKKYERFTNLSHTGALSKASLEDEENNYKIALLNLSSAETSLKAKEFALTLTKLNAPFDGVISKSFKSIGDFVSSGTPLFEIVQNNDLSVYAQVPVSYFNKFKVGMIFSFSNPITQQSGQMTIHKIVPVIDDQSHTFDIYGKINSSIQTFAPGMFVEINLK